ncbi:hypothetical protein AO368_0723 [Moraxella catarrhalis]|nr:hypothetical protein AO368_0723 [Moraxella catarrhalis]
MTWLGLIINNAYHTKKTPINTTNTPSLAMINTKRCIWLTGLNLTKLLGFWIIKAKIFMSSD